MPAVATMNENANQIASQKNVNKMPENPVKILVADDDDSMRRFLIKALNGHANYDIQAASSGTEACVKLGGDPPDLVILDIQMPDMDGVEVCRLIKKTPELAGTRVIVVSAFPDSDEAKQISELGFRNILGKPLHLADFMETVEMVLKEESIKI